MSTPLADTLCAILALGDAQSAPGLRVTSVELQLPVALTIRGTAEAPELCATVSASRWQTPFDPPAAQIRLTARERPA